jgi:hypothetical protein
VQHTVAGDANFASPVALTDDGVHVVVVVDGWYAIDLNVWFETVWHVPFTVTVCDDALQFAPV